MVEISLSGITSGHWQCVNDDFKPQDSAKILLTLEQLDVYEAKIDNDFALRLTTDVEVKSLRSWFGRIKMIELTVASFTDGRVFSQARTLRDAGFKGEIKVSGPVIPDQAKFFSRVGVDTLIVESGERVQAFEKALQRYDLFYQTSSDGVSQVSKLRHSQQSKRKAS